MSGPFDLAESPGSSSQVPSADQDALEPANRGQESTAPGSWFGLMAALTIRAVFNPRLALDLIRLTWAFRAREWLRRPPFIPLPPKEYIRWRMYTAYGDENAIPPAQDVIRFARWRRAVMRL